MPQGSFSCDAEGMCVDHTFQEIIGFHRRLESDICLLLHHFCLRNRWSKLISHADGSNHLLYYLGSSVVECLTGDQEAAGSSLTGVTVLWSLSKTHLS